MGKGDIACCTLERRLHHLGAKCLTFLLNIQGDGETKRREERRRKDNQPTSTLFIVNFDTANTRERDLEKHFSPYGKLRRVQIKRNYGFIQYESLDDAITAREATSLSRLLGEHAACCCQAAIFISETQQSFAHFAGPTLRLALV